MPEGGPAALPMAGAIAILKSLAHFGSNHTADQGSNGGRYGQVLQDRPPFHDPVGETGFEQRGRLARWAGMIRLAPWHSEKGLPQCSSTNRPPEFGRS